MALNSFSSISQIFLSTTLSPVSFVASSSSTQDNPFPKERHWAGYGSMRQKNHCDLRPPWATQQISDWLCCIVRHCLKKSNLIYKNKAEELTVFLNFHITFCWYQAQWSSTTPTHLFNQNNWWLCVVWQLSGRTLVIVGKKRCDCCFGGASIWGSIPSHTLAVIPASKCPRCLDYIQHFQNQNLRRCYGGKWTWTLYDS